MNLHLQNKVILITDASDFLVSLLAQRLEEEGAIPCRIPLINTEYCVAAVEETALRYGRIDGLVNTLAEDDKVGLEKGEYDSFLKSLEQHVLYAYIITQTARPWLQAADGAVVNLIDHSAETGKGNSSGYAAGNGGRIGLTVAWAEELADRHIRVNGVVITNDQKAAVEAVIFLLSIAANSLHGELLHVDAGYTHLARELDIST